MKKGLNCKINIQILSDFFPLSILRGKCMLKFPCVWGMKLGFSISKDTQNWLNLLKQVKLSP